jgi:redox-sensitive bicupin YhaK (pirin superfamily)
VNLPARDKMAPPGYQTLLRQDIPVIELEGNAGSLRVIAGEYQGRKGPARTFTPMNVWDVRLRAGGDVRLALPGSHNGLLVVLKGRALVNGAEPVDPDEVALFERGEEEISIRAERDAALLVLTGEPLNEPVVGYGPFVMNTREEIHQAYADFQQGRFGTPAPA